MTQPNQMSIETDDLASFAAKVKASSLKLGTPDPALNAALTPSGFQASQALAQGVTDAMAGLARLKLGVSGTMLFDALLTERVSQLLTTVDSDSADAVRAALKEAADGVPTVSPKKPGDSAKPVPGRVS